MPPEDSTMANSLHSRIRGCILGGALGDALGAPVEFMSVADIRRQYGSAGIQEPPSPLALYTDDTQMAECVAEALLTRGLGDLEVTMPAMAEKFRAWSVAPLGGHRAPGNTCLEGCRRVAIFGSARWRETGLPRKGCGSVMRVHPIGCAFPGLHVKAALWGAEQSLITHSHPEACGSSAAMAAAISILVCGGGSDHLRPKRALKIAIQIADAHHAPNTARLLRFAGEVARDKAADVSPVYAQLQGWTGDEAIAAAFIAFLRHPADPRAALLEAANTPGDSDSIASLAGALVGAYNGVQSLPAGWLDRLERRDELDILAHQLCNLAIGAGNLV